MSSGAAIFVMGPAGSGKSTFCSALIRYCESLDRVAHMINLDPAAEHFEYEPSKDIRDLISVEDAMEELQYGPNGGLIFCLEYLLENIEWLSSDLGQYQDEFLIIDCPGQIELYTHSDIMSKIVDVFKAADYKTCALYLLESLFLQDVTKFFSGVLTATSVMLQLGIPHLNVISKMDLISSKHAGEEGNEEEDEEEVYDFEDETHELHRYFFPDPALLEEKLAGETRSKFYGLNKVLVNLVDEYGMVKFIPLNIRKDSSLENIMIQIDFATQFSEGLEPKERKEQEVDDDVDEDINF